MNQIFILFHNPMPEIAPDTVNVNNHTHLGFLSFLIFQVQLQFQKIGSFLFSFPLSAQTKGSRKHSRNYVRKNAYSLINLSNKLNVPEQDMSGACKILTEEKLKS